ncbi:MAG: PHP-associated domain-containing protein [Chloroflexota bacterium]
MIATRSFVDLHCHTSASFDSLASPKSVVAAAARRGLTHLAITDHDRIDGALAARDAAPEGLSVLVGEEIRTRDGDLIAVFLSEAVRPGMTAVDTISAVRDQGGLVGIPHPFDRFRGSLAKDGAPQRLEALAASVDWIETWNARLLFGDGNQRAAELARAVDVPGVAVSDAHMAVEVGVAYTALMGTADSADELRAALAAGPALVMGRASAYVRLVTPIAKVINRARGRGRVRTESGA